MKLDATSFRGD